MKKLLPSAQCPACGGPVTFVQVMSILTPFQSIDCRTCGKMLFLRHRAEIFQAVIVVSVIAFWGGYTMVAKGFLSPRQAYPLLVFFLIGMEYVFTFILVRTNDLVVRKEEQ